MIVHEPTKEWALPQDHEIYDHVKMARLKQNMETPLTRRIRKATWPELLCYLSTAAMDSRYAGPSLEKAYRHTFRKYLERWTPLDPDKQPDPLDKNPSLNDYETGKLEELRTGIKKDRDKWFLDNKYDELEIQGVPKSFWLDETFEEEDAYQDANSQSVLDQFI